MKWIAGWNLSGYVPEMEPFVTDSYGDAVEYLLDELERWIDSDGGSWDDDEDYCTWDERHDTYLRVVSEIEGQRVNGAEVGMYFPDRNGNDYWWWVIPHIEEEEA